MIRRTVLYVLVPVTIFVLVVLGIARAADVPAHLLLRDSNAVFDDSFYIGFFSMLGIALWASAAAVCLLALSTGVSGPPRKLLIAGAVTSLIALIDDGFLVHETLNAEFGIPEPATYAVYGVVVIALFWPAWRYLVSRPNFIVFVFALVFFALSLWVDIRLVWSPPYRAILEDVFKFFGIVLWVTFFAVFCRAVLMSRDQEEMSTRSVG